VPLAIVDGELGRIVQGPAVTTWPKLRPAGVVNPDGSPATWGKIPPNQRFVPQSPPDPVDPEVADDCLVDCGDDCAGCDCGCHSEAEGQGDQEPVAYVMSEQERSALNRLRKRIGKQRGSVKERAKRIKDSPEARRFVEAAVRAEQARTAGGARPAKKG